MDTQRRITRHELGSLDWWRGQVVARGAFFVSTGLISREALDRIDQEFAALYGEAEKRLVQPTVSSDMPL